jgi:hypothetical protein
MTEPTSLDLMSLLDQCCYRCRDGAGGPSKAEPGAGSAGCGAAGAALTTRAAIAYLHGSDERQQVIADALSSRAAAELNRPETKPSGTRRARQRGRAS